MVFWEKKGIDLPSSLSNERHFSEVECYDPLLCSDYCCDKQAGHTPRWEILMDSECLWYIYWLFDICDIRWILIGYCGDSWLLVFFVLDQNVTELDLRTHMEPLYHPQLVRMPRLRTPAQCGTPSGQHRRGVLREVVKVRQGILKSRVITLLCPHLANPGKNVINHEIFWVYCSCKHFQENLQISWYIIS